MSPTTSRSGLLRCQKKNCDKKKGDGKMGKFKVVFTLLILSVSLVIPLDALAEEDMEELAGFSPEDMYDPEEFTGLTGDWGGQRTKLAEDGITIDIISFRVAACPR